MQIVITAVIFGIVALIGGSMLQYDLGVWLPVLHRAYPEVFGKPVEVALGWLVVPGFFLFRYIFVLTLVTAVLHFSGAV